MKNFQYTLINPDLMLSFVYVAGTSGQIGLVLKAFNFMELESEVL